jgi:hypothetical protein
MCRAADRRVRAWAAASSRAGLAPGSMWTFALAHGLLLGLFGSSATFAPLVADTSLWFVRRRGIAVAICASGNYLAGAIWPPIVQHFVERSAGAATYIGLGCSARSAMPLLALLHAPRPPRGAPAAPGRGARTVCRRPPLRPEPGRRRRCCAWPAWPAAWRWRCRRCTSWPTAATWASARRAAPRCCR